MANKRDLFTVGVLIVILTIVGCKTNIGPNNPSFVTSQLTPLVTSILAEPRPAMLSNGTIQTNYEIICINALSHQVTLENLKVIDPATPAGPIISLSQKELLTLIRIPGSAQATTTFGPGQMGYIRINLLFEDVSEIPSEFNHIITLSNASPSPSMDKTITQHISQAAVNFEPVPVISPPLKGNNWVADAVGLYSPHRLTTMPIDGALKTPERWAVDWIKLTSDNKLSTGDPKENKSYPQYGEEIIAVADGVILNTVNNLPDGQPGKMPANITIDTAGGNYVYQDIGNGYSAFYAHLIPGTLKFKKGDFVKKGEVLGLLGNSGNSDAPHLHFQVNKGQSPLGSDGVPYLIDSFTQIGYLDSKDYLETELKAIPHQSLEIKPLLEKMSRCSNKMPFNIAVVNFSD